MRNTPLLWIIIVAFSVVFPPMVAAQPDSCRVVGATSEGEPLFVCEEDQWLTVPICDPRIAGDCTGNEMPYPGPSTGRPPMPYRGGRPGPAAGQPPVGAAGGSPIGAAGRSPRNAAGAPPTTLGQTRPR
jgi:hypothetical protein